MEWRERFGRARARGVMVGVLVGTVVLAVAAEARESSVEGHLAVNGQSVELPYVYVIQQGEWFEERTTKMLFAAEAIAEEDLATWSHGEHAFVQIVLVGPGAVPPTGRLAMGGTTRVAQNVMLSKGHTFLAGGARPEVELTEATAEQIAGRVWLDKPAEQRDDTYQYDLTFSAPVTSSGASTGPAPEPLPAGGGAPGLAYLEYVEALASGDPERICEVVDQETMSWLGPEIEGKDAEEVVAILDSTVLQYQTLPQELEVVGGLSDGRHAVLEVEGVDQDAAITGRITLAEDGGRWVVTGMDWE